MELKEFALKLGQAELVRQKRSRIQDAFCVRVDFTSQAEAAARTGLEWIAVSGISASDCENAREYIMAVACPESQICLPIPEWFACELQRDNQFLCKSLEKQSKAALTFLSSKELHVRGSRQSVDLGMTLVLSQLAKLSSNSLQNMPPPHTERNAGHASLVDSGTRDFLQKIGYSNADITCAAMKLASLSQEINADTLMGLLVLLVRTNKSEEVLSQHAEVASLTEGNLSRPGRTIAEASATQAKALVSPANSERGTSTLRDIVIDGSNIALCHGCKKVFSCRGIQIVVDWFKKRGHQNIIAFVPEWRKEASKPESPIDKQEILLQLEQEGHLVFTPSRRLMDGRRVTPYDDRYILKYAASLDSIVVSNDNYRDLQKENPDWKNIVEKRLLMYSFVGDMFMPPDDPLGRHGPNLDEFLMKGSLPSKTCPYRNKCTYGAKCRFYHPEKSGEVTDTDALDQRKSSNSASSSSGFDNSAHAVQEERHSKQDARRPVLSCAAEMRRLNLSDSTQCLDNEIRAKGPTRNVRSANSPFLESPGLFSGPGGISPHGSQFLDARGDREAMFAPGVSYKQELHGAGQPVYSVSHSDYYPSPGYPPWTTYPGYPNPDGRGNNAYIMSPHNQYGAPSPYITPPVVPAPAMRPGERLYNNQMGYAFDSVSQRSQQRMQTPVMMTNAPQIQSFNVAPGSHHALRSSPAEPLSLYYQLVEMFPGNEAVVRRVLLENQNEADANVLVSCILRSIST